MRSFRCLAQRPDHRLQYKDHTAQPDTKQRQNFPFLGESHDPRNQPEFENPHALQDNCNYGPQK